MFTREVLDFVAKARDRRHDAMVEYAKCNGDVGESMIAQTIWEPLGNTGPHTDKFRAALDEQAEFIMESARSAEARCKVRGDDGPGKKAATRVIGVEAKSAIAKLERQFGKADPSES